ncbi:hypothetical protein Tco_0901917 [Tanacetum coccineum]
MCRNKCISLRMVKMGLFKAIDSLIPLDEHLDTFRGNGYLRKGQKPSQNGQNRAREREEHERKVKSKPKVKKSTKVKPDKVKVKAKAVNEEILNRPTQHQKPSSLLVQPEILEWKWKKITMDFVINSLVMDI